MASTMLWWTRYSKRHIHIADLVWNLVAVCLAVAGDAVPTDRPRTSCRPCFYSSLPDRTFHLCYDDRSSARSTATTAHVSRSSELDFVGRSVDVDDFVIDIDQCPPLSWSIHRAAPDTATVARPADGDRRTLPDRCFEPDVVGCEWYTDCLETAYPCNGTLYRYAVEYGSVYCGLFQRNSEMFSPVGRRWSRAVTTCLIEALVESVLGSTLDARSCVEIERIAHESHVPCYLRPGPEEPSVCDITLSDWFVLVWTLRYALIDTTMIGELISGGLQLVYGCSVR